MKYLIVLLSLTFSAQLFAITDSNCFRTITIKSKQVDKINLNNSKAIKNGKVKVNCNQELALTWYVYGPEGTFYELSILVDDKMVFRHADTLDFYEYDAGLKWVKIK